MSSTALSALRIMHLFLFLFFFSIDLSADSLGVGCLSDKTPDEFCKVGKEITTVVKIDFSTEHD